jgi:ribose transport system permease protein
MRRIKEFVIDKNTYIVLIMLFGVCCALSENFFTVMNLRNLALQQAAPICVAVGMLFVILTGGIDLSVGSIMALGASLTAILIAKLGVSIPVAILISMTVGGALGSLTGFFVAVTKMQGFIASLAMMTIARGAAFIMTNGIPVRLEKGTLDILVDEAYGYPIIIISLLVIIVFWLIQKYTAYGRIVIAVGSNHTAVELAGIRVKRYLLSVYIISGALSALAGVYCGKVFHGKRHRRIGTGTRRHYRLRDRRGEPCGRKGYRHPYGHRRVHHRTDRKHHESDVRSVLSAGCHQGFHHHHCGFAAACDRKVGEDDIRKPKKLSK